MKLQPLRIKASWQVIYNQLYEVDPVLGYESYFEGSSLLILQNNNRLKLIDLQWRPERDLNGEFQLKVLNFLENYNSKTNEFENDPNWERPFLTFTTNSRVELIEKLEELLKILPVYKDPRITKRRGVIDEPSESYRLELKENGISIGLIDNILENGNAKIQTLILDDKNISRETILKFSEMSIFKKVRNFAKQKLKSKRIKE